MHQSASVMMAYEFLNDHMAGCTNRHPSCWETEIVKCVSKLPNEKKDGIHRMESVMNVNCIDKVK